MSGFAKGAATVWAHEATTTASEAVPAEGNRRSVTIHNVGTATVYLGTDTNVTTVSGFPLEAGQSLRDDGSISAWWAITGADTADLRIIEVQG